jgi:hypothetical protein
MLNRRVFSHQDALEQLQNDYGINSRRQIGMPVVWGKKTSHSHCNNRQFSEKSIVRV